MAICRNCFAFAGCFTSVDRVPLESDEQIDLLKIDIKKLSRDYDAVHRHILEMADALSAGIMAQFPGRFRA